MGEYRWLTVIAPDGPASVELLLEPSAHPAVAPYRNALVADGIPCTSFAVDDIEATCNRLQGLGVEFKVPPTRAGSATIAVFDDTCGSLIQLAQVE